MEIPQRYTINTIKLIQMWKDLKVDKNHLPLLNQILIIISKEDIDLIRIYTLKLILDYEEIFSLHNKIGL